MKIVLNGKLDQLSVSLIKICKYVYFQHFLIMQYNLRGNVLSYVHNIPHACVMIVKWSLLIF